jgi:hypothetical protein
MKAYGKISRIEQQIKDLRSRRSFDSEEAECSDASTRIHSLRRLLEDNSEEPELRRHAVVSGIAALETFHRGFLLRTMNFDARIAVRASELIGDKYSLRDTLEYIGGDRISAAELIAHLAPVNSLGDLISWTERIFEKDVKTLLSNAVSPWQRDDDQADLEPLISDVSTTFALIEDAFRLRHIWAHEAAPALEIHQDHALQLIGAINDWMKASEGALWRTLWREVPLTQMEMNFASSHVISEARRQLAQAMRELRTQIGRAKRAALRRNHLSWRSTSSEFVQLAYGTRTGSMWPAVAGGLTASMIEERVMHIRSWSSANEPF